MQTPAQRHTHTLTLYRFVCFSMRRLAPFCCHSSFTRLWMERLPFAVCIIEIFFHAKLNWAYVCDSIIETQKSNARNPNAWNSKWIWFFISKYIFGSYLVFLSNISSNLFHLFAIIPPSILVFDLCLMQMSLFLSTV